MRKAIRQTEGMIAHLLSAYRGILRHAYLAGLILTLAGGGLTASRIACAETESDGYTAVNASELADKKFTDGEKVRVVSNGAELARFTVQSVTGDNVSDSILPELTYTQSGNGPHGTITVTKGSIAELTVSANTTVTVARGAGGYQAVGNSFSLISGVSRAVTLNGGGAAFSLWTGYKLATAADSTGPATFDPNRRTITGTAGSKISDFSSLPNVSTSFSGTLDLSELSGRHEIRLDKGTTITTGQITVKMPENEVHARIVVDSPSQTVTLKSGTYDSVTKSGNGKVEVEGGAAVTIKSLEVDYLNVEHVTADFITATGDVSAESFISVKDTLKAKNITAHASKKAITAGTIEAAGNIDTCYSDTVGCGRILVTSGSLTADNVSAGSIDVAGAVKAAGDVIVRNPRYGVTGSIRAASITAGGVSAVNAVEVTESLTAKSVSAKTIRADSIAASESLTADSLDVKNADISGNVDVKNASVTDTLTIKEGSAAVLAETASVSAGTLSVLGTVSGNGKITVNKAADVSGSLTAGTLTLARGTESVISEAGSVTVDNLTAAGTVNRTGSTTGRITVNSRADIAGALKAESLYAKAADISADVEVTEAELGDMSVKDSGALLVKSLTSFGALDAYGKTISADDFIMKSGSDIAAGTEVTAKNASVAENAKTTVNGKLTATDKLTLENGSTTALSDTGSVTAGTLKALGSVDGTGKITVNRSADISGSLKAKELTLAQGSESVLSETGSVTVDNLTAAGAVNSSGSTTGRITVNNKADITGALKAGSLYAKTADISAGVEVGEAELGDTTLKDSGALTVNKLTSFGVLDANGKTISAESFTMKSGSDITAGTKVTAKDVTVAAGAKATVNGELNADNGLTLGQGSALTVAGNKAVTAKNVTSSGTVAGNGTVKAAETYTMEDGSAIDNGAMVSAGNAIVAENANISIAGTMDAGYGTLTLGQGSSSNVTGTLTADSIDSSGAIGGSGRITVNNAITMQNGSSIKSGASVTAKSASVAAGASAGVDGTLTVGSLTLGKDSLSTVNGTVAADTLVVSGAIAGSGKTVVNDALTMNGGSAILGTASVTAKNASADSVKVEGSLAAESLKLSGISAVSGTVTADALSASGTLSGSGTVTANKTLSLGGAFNLTGGTALDAGTSYFGGYSAMLVGESASAPSLLTMTGLSSSGTEGVMNGSLTAGRSSAFYIGDMRGGSELFKSELKDVDGKNLKALGFIDKKVTLASGSSITVDGTLTSAPGASAVSAASLRTSAVPALVLNGVPASAVSSASVSAAQADTVTVGKGSKLTVSAAALEDGAAVIFEKGGTVNNAGTIELTKTDIEVNQVIPVFGAESGSVTDNTESMSGEYTMLNGAFILDPLGNGSVLARYRGIQDEGVDSSVKGPVNSWIEAGGKVADGTFLSEAMDSEESAKASNSAARFSVLSGTIQNSLLAGKASYDSVSERLGFGAASIARQGAIEGTSAGVWLQPVYMHYDSDGFSAVLTDDYGVSSGLYGTVLGADVKFGGNYIVGAAFSTGTGTSHSDGSHSYTSSDFDFWGGSLYGSMELGGFTIAADTGVTRLTGDAEADLPYREAEGRR